MSAEPGTAIVKLDTPANAWRELISPEGYQVLFQEATESAFSSPLNAEKRGGTFICAACFLPLFDAEAKFDSGTGWPSFTAQSTAGSGRRATPQCHYCGRSTTAPAAEGIRGTSFLTALRRTASDIATTASRCGSCPPASRSRPCATGPAQQPPSIHHSFIRVGSPPRDWMGANPCVGVVCGGRPLRGAAR